LYNAASRSPYLSLIGPRRIFRLGVIIALSMENGSSAKANCRIFSVPERSALTRSIAARIVAR
jgi:hypothetical protein